MLYRTVLPVSSNGWTIDLQSPVHDFAHVLVNGQCVAALDRTSGQTMLQLPALGTGNMKNMVNDLVNDEGEINSNGGPVLDILVQVIRALLMGWLCVLVSPMYMLITYSCLLQHSMLIPTQHPYYNTSCLLQHSMLITTLHAYYNTACS